jgi:two-component system C4-dicarboxylate transport sensor histidine kinase DctB
MRRFALFATLFAIVSSGGLLLLYSWANSYYLSRAQLTGQSTLKLVAEAVDQAVGRFAPIPSLIAGDPDLQKILNPDTALGFAPFINEKLRQITISVGASEVYVMNSDGFTVAASNYRDEDSFLGRNFSYRPYFTQSLAGQTAIFHALGTTSGERGFFFAAPILNGIEVVGVLAVKMNVDALEIGWLDNDHQIMIADPNGIIFLTNRLDFRFRALAPLQQDIRRQIQETRQYPLERIVPIELSADVVRPSTVQVTLSESRASESLLSTSAPLGLPGWHAIVFTSLDPVDRQVWRTMALGIASLVAVLLGVMLVIQRRASILRQIQIEQEQRSVLEERVKERTASLDEANANLRGEVEERRNAEEQLRKSQKELIQAGKLAALGQMSAAISHEINQPLAAIKSYAENASEYLKRSRTEEAQANVQSIALMSDRMTEISQHLRNFARQPGDSLKAVNISDTVDATLGLVGPQLRAQGAVIDYSPAHTDQWGLGGELRLQQVLVNIIANALEAMKGQMAPKIEISTKTGDDQIAISLRDFGPGVAKEDLEKVFDAFYTTKTAGAGMGLGLSISHNIISDFGGNLVVENHPDGGAVFTVHLQKASPTLSESATA